MEASLLLHFDILYPWLINDGSFGLSYSSVGLFLLSVHVSVWFESLNLYALKLREHLTNSRLVFSPLVQTVVKYLLWLWREMPEV